MKKEKGIRRNISFYPSDYNKLKKYAQSIGKSIAQVVREYIRGLKIKK